MNPRKTKVMIIFFLLLFLLFLNSLPPSRADLNSTPSLEVRYAKGYRNDPSLVLYLPLLEGKGSMAFDISGFKNHGMLKPNGAAIWLTSGGLYFNGEDDSIIVNASMSLQSAHKTVIVRLMWDGKGKDSELYLYDDGWAYDGSMIIFVHPATSRLYVEFKTKAGTQKNLWHTIVPNKVYTAIFRFDDLNYYLWLNTEEKSGSFEEVEELGVNHNVGIGSNYVKTRRWFSGNIYTVQVFNRSLSDSEIPDLYASFQETPRADPESKYVIGGWAAPHNDSFPISGLEDILAYLNRTYVTSLDEYGMYRFIFDLPLEAGNYTYEVTVENMAGGEEAYTSVVVDKVVVSEFGSTNVGTGQEAIAWFKLKSEFDGQLVESGMVNLTGGLTAAWNPDELRWEYRESRDEESSLFLSVESITWDKYGITALHPNAHNNVTTIHWQRLPWYTTLVRWLLGVGPATWGVVAILIILVAFVRLGIIKCGTNKQLEPIEHLRQKADSLLQSLSEKDIRFTLLHQFLYKLLDENPPPEVLEFLQDFLPDIVKHLTEHSHAENHLDHKGR